MTTKKFPIPKAEFNRLGKQADSLVERVLKHRPTKEYPFIVVYLASWFEDTFCNIYKVMDVLPREGANAAEKQLLKYVDMDYIFEQDSLRQAIYESKEIREYNKEIKEFCKFGESLEKKYDFDFNSFLMAKIYS